jgi:hypothetical protein
MGYVKLDRQNVVDMLGIRLSIWTTGSPKRPVIAERWFSTMGALWPSGPYVGTRPLERRRRVDPDDAADGRSRVAVAVPQLGAETEGIALLQGVCLVLDGQLQLPFEDVSDFVAGLVSLGRMKGPSSPRKVSIDGEICPNLRRSKTDTQ